MLGNLIKHALRHHYLIVQLKTMEIKNLTNQKNLSTVVDLETHDRLAHKVIENHTTIREALRIAIKNYIKHGGE